MINRSTGHHEILQILFQLPDLLLLVDYAVRVVEILKPRSFDLLFFYAVNRN